MTSDSSGFILVRVANKGKKNELVIPQRVAHITQTNVKSQDTFDVLTTTLYGTWENADAALQHSKLGRPESQLEIRQAVVKLEILT